MVIQRDNLDILNKPFLSQAEEMAFKSVVVEEHFLTDKERKRVKTDEHLAKLRPNYTSEELLKHLNVNRTWE